MNRDKNKNFFAWYYEEGLHEFLEIWKNFLVFVWRHFSVLDLLETLFSPWKRDVAYKNWRGLNIEKTLTLFVNNILSRMIGSVVRIIVIISGISLFLLLFVFGALLLLIWLIMPALFLFIIYKIFFEGIIFIIALCAVVLYAGIIFWGYILDTKKDLYSMSLQELYSENIFERICNRLGTTKKAFSATILENKGELSNFLAQRGLSVEDLEKIVDWEIGLHVKRFSMKAFWRMENLEKIPKIGSQWKYAYTVKLDRYSTDLSIRDNTEYANKKLNGRADELEILKLILERPDQNCAIISGGTGIGKNTLVHSLASDIRLGKSESFLKNKRILILDLGKAISDFVDKGEDVDGKVRELFVEATNAGNIILFIKHFEQYLGKEANMYHPDVAPIINEFLTYNSFQVIATSSTKEYHNFIEKHDQMLKYFEVVEMREPSDEEAVEILYEILEPYEEKRVIFTHDAIRTCIRESEKYNWSSPLPERAIDLAMDSMMFWNKKPDSLFVSSQTVADFLSLKTGTPHGEIKDSEKKKLLNLEEILHRQVIGQEEAIKQIAEALRRSRSGISNPGKPVGTFLFLGPTGVGKTETAKALAKTYFGDEEKMIRLDMSEFQSPSSIDRLIGSSQLGQQGRLATMVKDNPYSLILLDEIEKAYPDILDIFLQILDEGYVTDAFGEKINFRNSLIVATSNAGAALIKEEVEKEFDVKKIKEDVINYAIENNLFRVEFLNRFDGVIFFRPLRGSEVESVTRLMLGKFSKRILKEKNMDVSFSESVVRDIMEKGYSPIFGARSIDHYMKEKVEDLIARKIISGDLKSGGKIILDI